MSSKAIIDYTMEDDSLGVRDALYSAIQDRVMAHIEAKKAEIASNFITQQEEVEQMYEGKSFPATRLKDPMDHLKDNNPHDKKTETGLHRAWLNGFKHSQKETERNDNNVKDNPHDLDSNHRKAWHNGFVHHDSAGESHPHDSHPYEKKSHDEFKGKMAKYKETLNKEEVEELDEIDRNALYHRLQGSIAAKNKAYSLDNAREFSGGNLRDAGEKKASLANHVAGIRKAQGTLGKLTSSNPKNSVIKPQAEEYVNIPEGVEVFVPTNSINEASKEEHPWRMDKDRKGTGYHIINSVRPKMAKVNGIHKTIGLEHDGVHSHAFESHHEAEKAAYDLAERGHTCTHHCPQGYVKAVVQPSHSFEI